MKNGIINYCVIFHDEGLPAGYLHHSAHISKETRAWLAGQPAHRSEFTFTPKHGSWLNLVEGFFSKLARSVLRHIRVATGLRWREGKGPQGCQVAKCD